MALAAEPQLGQVHGERAYLPRLSTGWVGGILLLLIALPCFVTLPISLDRYEGVSGDEARADLPPNPAQMDLWMGTDALGRSVLWRCALGGAISLGIGLGAACMAVAIGVAWGATAGYIGGRTDAVMMRIVDVIYGLPYILLVVLLDLAFQPLVAGLVQRVTRAGEAEQIADVLTLFVAIGSVSWLTMARVIRGQVLSLRAQPFIEAARACGVGPLRIMGVHLLPNLVGPIVVYTTLTVPTAILQESFLSFLGIGVQAPLPSWGNLAAVGVAEFPELAVRGSTMEWWLLLFPCLLLGLTLMALNFVGDALRQRLDPKRG